METKTLQKIQKQAMLLVILLTNLAILKAQVGNVIWEENFNTFNTDIWTPIVGDGCAIGLCGWGNAELEYYSSDNVYIADIPGESGNKALVLEARNQTMGSASFTSGKVDTEGKLSIQYGLIEIRLRVPNLETGLWPAAWLLGTVNLGWPAKGEIDMMEMGHNLTERTRQGFPSAPVNNFVGSNAIWQNSADGGVASIAWDVDYDQPYVSSTPLNDRFVTYRLYWEPTQMRYTVVDNGIEYDLYTNPFPLDSEGDTKTFQRPFYMLLNLAVGGNFTDAANASQVTAPMPAKMYIDYVRVSEWNGYGNVEFDDGQLTAESGVFGVFTDNTPTNNELDFGNDAAIYVWGGTMHEGSTPAYEGSNVVAWETTTPNNWFGGGIVSLFGKNMSNFVDEGKLKFKIKIPANVSFKIGVTDNYTNEKYVDFPAEQTKYGLVRNGDWGQVEIPIADFSGLIAFQDMNYLFAIVSDAANLPSSTFQLAIDDIIWDDGNGTTIIPVTGVTVLPTSKTLKVDENQQLSATVLPSNATNKNISWTSSNPSIATVSSTGLVTAKSVGNATITVATEDGNFTATCSITVEADNSLPSPWETGDIGSVGAVGSATYNSGTFTLEGSGADIWGNSDEFRYVYQPIDGDVVITAKVNSLSNTDAWAKAGVMIRENLNNNSKHAMTVVTAGNGTAFQRRVTTGGSSAHNAGPSASAPYWGK
ncbi:MAG: family 16 glycosylhydrolase, partial [Chloroflexia bacterium]|nr:family 16 glycosylhydrolase [Chloroflexia bacterium]